MAQFVGLGIAGTLDDRMTFSIVTDVGTLNRQFSRP